MYDPMFCFVLFCLRYKMSEVPTSIQKSFYMALFLCIMSQLHIWGNSKIVVTLFLLPLPDPSHFWLNFPSGRCLGGPVHHDPVRSRWVTAIKQLSALWFWYIWYTLSYFLFFSVALFTLVGFIQMTIWAKGKHKIYTQEFKDYPNLRMTILPFILWHSHIPTSVQNAETLWFWLRELWHIWTAACKWSWFMTPSGQDYES